MAEGRNRDGKSDVDAGGETLLPDNALEPPAAEVSTASLTAPVTAAPDQTSNATISATDTTQARLFPTDGPEETAAARLEAPKPVADEKSDTESIAATQLAPGGELQAADVDAKSEATVEVNAPVSSWLNKVEDGNALYPAAGQPTECAVTPESRITDARYEDATASLGPDTSVNGVANIPDTAPTAADIEHGASTFEQPPDEAAQPLQPGQRRSSPFDGIGDRAIVKPEDSISSMGISDRSHRPDQDTGNDFGLASVPSADFASQARRQGKHRHSRPQTTTGPTLLTQLGKALAPLLPSSSTLWNVASYLAYLPDAASWSCNRLSDAWRSWTLGEEYDKYRQSRHLGSSNVVLEFDPRGGFSIKGSTRELNGVENAHHLHLKVVDALRKIEQGKVGPTTVSRRPTAREKAESARGGANSGLEGAAGVSRVNTHQPPGMSGRRGAAGTTVFDGASGVRP